MHVALRNNKCIQNSVVKICWKVAALKIKSGM
jgi:hypothetical protein